MYCGRTHWGGDIRIVSTGKAKGESGVSNEDQRKMYTPSY